MGPTCQHHLLPHLFPVLPLSATARSSFGSWWSKRAVSPASTSFSPAPPTRQAEATGAAWCRAGSRSASPAYRGVSPGPSRAAASVVAPHASFARHKAPAPPFSPLAPSFLLPLATSTSKAELPPDLLATPRHQTQILLSRPSSTLLATSPTCSR